MFYSICCFNELFKKEYIEIYLLNIRVNYCYTLCNETKTEVFWIEKFILFLKFSFSTLFEIYSLKECLVKRLFMANLKQNTCQSVYHHPSSCNHSCAAEAHPHEEKEKPKDTFASKTNFILYIFVVESFFSKNNLLEVFFKLVHQFLSISNSFL